MLRQVRKVRLVEQYQWSSQAPHSAENSFFYLSLHETAVCR